MEIALKIAQIVNAFGTFAIGVAVAWIAHLQSRNARQRLAVDLFEKKFEVLKDVSKMHAEFLVTGKPKEDHIGRLYQAEIRSRALYGPGVADILKMMQKEVRSAKVADYKLEESKTENEKNKWSIEQRKANSLIGTLFPKCVDSLTKEIQP